ncbi:DNA damage response protein kinase-like protein [Elsinoe australis]|uniref:DNA damage response protein kinase-like protein n=1 Tax=Elsinoe australis TaxID=40998 RepID=A0A4U7AW16_9PEZI|nr:DNA damage response protein kinase-like protein [Elsinoe australis]
MPPAQEKSTLKRARGSIEETESMKKPRRSSRLTSQSNPNHGGLPSPVTGNGHSDDRVADSPPPPPMVKTPEAGSPKGPSQLHSPPSDTQPFSQFMTPAPYSYEVKDEEDEGVWGYLIPLDNKSGTNDTLVLKRRSACPLLIDRSHRSDGKHRVDKTEYLKQEKSFESAKMNEVPAGGYLLGRHPECDRIISEPTVSNRHCLFFSENKLGDSTAVLEDLSGNGTYVNDAYVGRNKRRELNDGDEISILDVARFVFRYPRRRETNGFRQQYNIEGALGKGHFATVYLCTEKNTGMRYAVKHFERRMKGPSPAEDKSKIDGLQQEIAVLMSVSHPNMLCLKDTFNESDGVYLVLELAPEGELFNWIVMKGRLSEAETRKIFVQLFQGVKYLHERNIVHRDIKPENILLIDKDLSVKLADFGLAKIIGEESFTTTLCGTPSYVAPEILEPGNRRRYTRAVDIWSLGVVLYICLCGFPPFSDELYTRDNPYTLSQQIKMGRFDYPSPYWDSVGDPALDLIDKMLTVDVNRRISVEDCLEHPWTTGRVDGPPGKDGIANPGVRSFESTDGLTGALGNLDFSSRKPHRERTLLSAINDVHIAKTIDVSQKGDKAKVKVFEKNEGVEGNAKEPSPADKRNPEEFVRMGGKGDQVLFSDPSGSVYQDKTMQIENAP